jgi:hypothetical protein
MRADDGYYHRGAIFHFTREGTLIETREEFEKSLDNLLKKDWALEYNLWGDRLRGSHPRVYRVLKSLGLPHPY